MNMYSLRSCIRCVAFARNLTPVNYTSRKLIHRYVRPTITELVHRKKRLGPQPKPARSSFVEWNQDAELFAFNKRLSEKFDPDLLLTAFTFRSYVIEEEQRQKSVGIDTTNFQMQDNYELIEHGSRLTEQIVKAYLCKALPKAPEECIYGILNYLLSQKVLANRAKYLGSKDLILTADSEVSEENLALTFFALVGALAESPEVDSVHVANFVRDFLIAGLAEKELAELWCPDDPEEILNKILARENRELAEPRLIGQSGMRTLIAAYQVAFYSNKQMVGKGFGETIDEARKAAATDALTRMFGIADSCRPIPFDLTIDISSELRTENLPLTQWCTENVNQLMHQ